MSGSHDQNSKEEISVYAIPVIFPPANFSEKMHVDYIVRGLSSLIVVAERFAEYPKVAACLQGLCDGHDSIMTRLGK